MPFETIAFTTATLMVLSSLRITEKARFTLQTNICFEKQSFLRRASNLIIGSDDIPPNSSQLI